MHIGSGHIMRCLTLADALRARGAECLFICQERPGHMMDLIEGRGYPAYRLPVLGADSPADARQTIPILSELRPEWLVVDHYSLDSGWEDDVRPQCRSLFVIDDLVRAHRCDLLLDQTFGRSTETYRTKVPADCAVLAGSEYALLRPEFAELRDRSLKRRSAPGLRTVLVSMGGVDQFNITSVVLDALGVAPLPSGCSLKVVMGRRAPWLNEVRRQAREMPWSTRVFVDVTDMASLMAEADFAIGAGGSTSWERCCLGLPSFVVVTADNQREAAAALHRAGAAYVVTDAAKIAPALLAAIGEQVRDADSALRVSTAASAVTDGYGTQRVLSHLCEATLG